MISETLKTLLLVFISGTLTGIPAFYAAYSVYRINKEKLDIEKKVKETEEANKDGTKTIDLATQLVDLGIKKTQGDNDLVDGYEKLLHRMQEQDDMRQKQIQEYEADQRQKDEKHAKEMQDVLTQLNSLKQQIRVLREGVQKLNEQILEYRQTPVFVLPVEDS